MLSISQFLVVILFIGDSLAIRRSRPKLYEDDCTIAPNVLAPDLPENCHELTILPKVNSSTDSQSQVHTDIQSQVLTAARLNQHPAAIVTLNITDGGLTGIERDCFLNHRKSLKTISIVGNNIATFPSYTFSDLSLKRLDLRNNGIVYLGMHPFDDSKIEDLNLNFNKVSALHKSVFSSEFLYIRLAKNRVSFIEPQCFPSSLEFLDLRHNLLYDIERDHFSNLENLKVLYLANNYLLNVDFTDNDLNKLEVLDLSFNQIASLNQASCNAMTKLEFLNITNNNIKWISSGTLRNFGKLKVLDISLNRFSNFPYGHLPNSIEAINNFGNPWNCGCFFRMERYLAQNEISSFKCLSKSRELPFCVSYGNMDTCTDIPNESLITVFTQHMSTDLIQHCSLSGSIRHVDGNLLSPKPLVPAV